MKILLADDARFFLAIERQFLRKTPAQVIEARDSDEAMALALQQRPGLIYMAYTLRPESGVVCCRRIKQHPDLKHIPVVMICEREDDEQVRQSRLAGCSAYLVKPLDQLSFLQVGRQFLGEIREPRQTCLFQVGFAWGGRVERGRCLDISSGGMFIDTSHDIPVGASVHLTFKLPNLNLPELTVEGVVAWHNRRPNLLKPHYPIGFGVKFNELPAEFRDALGGQARR